MDEVTKAFLERIRFWCSAPRNQFYNGDAKRDTVEAQNIITRELQHVPITQNEPGALRVLLILSFMVQQDFETSIRVWHRENKVPLKQAKVRLGAMLSELFGDSVFVIEEE